MNRMRIIQESYWESYYRHYNPALDSKRDTWFKLKVSNRYWCADPFVVEENGTYHVFCELMDRHISQGLLGYGKLNLSGDTFIEPIADLGCHTSYPNVFKYDGEWYMIPETVKRKSIELYKAVSFPRAWERVATLVTGLNAVDTTYFEMNGRSFIFIYDQNGFENTLSIAELDIKKRQVVKQQKVFQYHQKIGRPAGNVYIDNGKWIRPTQYGVNHYGEAVVLREFVFNPDTFDYSESDCKTITAQDILPAKQSKDKTGFHTINRCYDIEIVDTFKIKTFFTRPFLLLCKKFKIFGCHYVLN